MSSIKSSPRPVSPEMCKSLNPIGASSEQERATFERASVQINPDHPMQNDNTPASRPRQYRLGRNLKATDALAAAVMKPLDSRLSEEQLLFDEIADDVPEGYMDFLNDRAIAVRSH